MRVRRSAARPLVAPAASHASRGATGTRKPSPQPPQPSPESGLPGLHAWAAQDWPIAADWQPLWTDFLRSPAGLQLGQWLQARLDTGALVYPAQPLRALALTPLAQVRVVILGQDPYHGAAQADGLAFSVSAGQRLPPSLRNIQAELQREFGARPASGSLEPWARQGVLLLNACLTVQAGQAASHAGQGWERFTQAVLRTCAAHGQPKAFLLWGRNAQAAADAAALEGRSHLLLRANHPSPLAARRPPQPFIGCGHFGAVNRWLQARGEKSIAWF